MALAAAAAAAGAGAATAALGGVGSVAFVDTLMDGVNEKSAALFVSFLPRMSERSVVSLRNECIDEDVVVGAVGFSMLSVGGEGDDEMPNPPPSRSSLFVLVGSISRFRSSIGTTRSVDGDPAPPPCAQCLSCSRCWPRALTAGLSRCLRQRSSACRN